MAHLPTVEGRRVSLVWGNAPSTGVAEGSKGQIRALLTTVRCLLGSTLVVGYFYVFEQNWFYAILFERYLGLGYLGYVAFLFFWLIEIVYLKARITQMVFDAVGSMLSKCGIPT